MNTVFRFRVLSVLLVLILLAASAIPALYAQEATETPAADGGEASDTPSILCEASVMLLAGLATRDYGYVIPAQFDHLERGQFAFLFDDDEETTTGADVQATEEAGTTGETDATTGDALAAATEQVPLPEAIVLAAPVILDEDALCTHLRENVLEFFATRPSGSGAGMGGSTTQGS